MKKEYGRNKLISRVIRDGLFFYREYCNVKGCDFERIGATVASVPMIAFPGGTPSCPECSKRKRHPLGLENAYGLRKIEIYKINVDVKK